MKTLEDLVSLKLYSAANKLYIPIDSENKKKNACIMLLSNDDKSALDIIDSPIIINNNGLFRAYYTNKDVEGIINHEGKIESINKDTEVISEASQYYKELEFASEDERYKIIINPSKELLDGLKSKYNELDQLKDDKTHDIVISMNDDELMCAACVDSETHIIDHIQSFGDYRNKGYEDTIIYFCSKAFKALPMNSNVEPVQEEVICKNNYKIITNPNKETFQKYKNDHKFLSHFRTNDDYDIAFFINKDNLIGAVSVNKTNHIIQAIEVTKEYQNHGYGKSLLEFCVKVFKANELSVNKKNDIAIKMYLKYGFKTYKEDNNMLYMKLHDVVTEEVVYKNNNNVKFIYNSGSASSTKEISETFNKDTVTELNAFLNNEVKLNNKTINIFVLTGQSEINKLRKTHDLNTIYVLSPTGFDEGKYGPYDMYLKHELALLLIKNLNPKIDNRLAIYSAMSIVGQDKYFKDSKSIENNGAIVISKIVDKYGRGKLVQILKKNDIEFVVNFALKEMNNKIKGLFDKEM